MDAEALRKTAGIIVLFRGFAIEERTKMGRGWNAKQGSYYRTCPFL